MRRQTDAEPVILPRAEHGISRTQIDPDSLKVMYRLHRAGYLAYLVGGSVRDLLLGRTPKDFDVGTDATPEQIKALFRNCWLVGRRFRLAHIRFGRDKVIEVATFRRQPEENELPENPDDHFHYVQNVFGTPREDAFRRDFTINALFYNIADFSVIDYVGGLQDLREQRLRVIGDPIVRFREDPVRMLRALEFAARLEFQLDPVDEDAIRTKAPRLLEAAPARVRDEILELFRHKVAGAVIRASRATGLLSYLIPDYEADDATLALLDAIDRRTAAGQQPAEWLTLFGFYLSPFLRRCAEKNPGHVAEAAKLAGQVLADHTRHFHMAAGTRAYARDLMTALWRLLRGRGHRGEVRFQRHPETRNALELLALWVEATGQHRDELAAWSSDAPAGAPPAGSGKKRRRRPRRRRKKTGGETTPSTTETP